MKSIINFIILYKRKLKDSFYLKENINSQNFFNENFIDNTLINFKSNEKENQIFKENKNSEVKNGQIILSIIKNYFNPFKFENKTIN